MRIYVSCKLLEVKEKLLNKGYYIINDNENTKCDVIVCNIKNGGLNDIIINKHLRREDILIIDSGSKSIEEIEYILNSRV